MNVNEIVKSLHKFDSAEISDALDSIGVEGALLGINPICPSRKAIGPAFTVQYVTVKESVTSYQNAGNYIDEVPKTSIIIIDNAGRTDCTTWGDILTQVSLQKSIAGTVIYGAARDISSIKKLGYPLYASAICMRSGKNRVKKIQQNGEITIQGVTIKPNDIIFCDENGVIVIPYEYTEDIITRADNIKLTEEKIVLAVKNGMSLKEARRKFRYDQPWLARS